MAIDTSFRTALERLAAAGRLDVVDRELDPVDEIAAVMKQRDGDRAVLFPRVRQAAIPVVGNVLSSPQNCQVAFGLDRHGIRAALTRGLSDPIDPVMIGGSAPVHERVIVGDEVDLLSQLPVLRHAPEDAGRFITAGVVIVVDPVTGVPNASYHRLQVVGRNRTGIKLDYGRHLRLAFERAQSSGRPLPVAVCLGTDLSLMHAAAFMGSQMPADASELAAAGGIRGRALELAAGMTQPVLVPADAEIVLEGYILPDVTVDEGPFGEFVGYPSDRGPAPVLEVSAITMRERPVYHAISGAGRETVMLRKYVLESSALRALRQAVPIVSDIDLTSGGLHRFHAIIQVAKGSARDEGLQRNAMLVAFGALKDLDHLVVVDDDIDVSDPFEVEYALATRFEASRDLVLIEGARGHEYIRVSQGGRRTKVGLDATIPFEERERFRRVRFAQVELAPGEIHLATTGSELPWSPTVSVDDNRDAELHAAVEVG